MYVYDSNPVIIRSPFCPLLSASRHTNTLTKKIAGWTAALFQHNTKKKSSPPPKIRETMQESKINTNRQKNAIFCGAINKG
jgi:hypothetical protein